MSRAMMVMLRHEIQGWKRVGNEFEEEATKLNSVQHHDWAVQSFKYAKELENMIKTR